VTDLATLLLVLALAAALWWWRRRRGGGGRAGHPGERLSAVDRSAVGAPEAAVVLLQDLGT
jgi:uncharacterized iron-regulated membrane protein